MDLAFYFKELIDSGALRKYNLLSDDLVFYYKEFENGNIHKEAIISATNKILDSKKILDFANYEF